MSACGFQFTYISHKTSSFEIEWISAPQEQNSTYPLLNGLWQAKVYLGKWIVAYLYPELYSVSEKAKFSQ